ncbi:MAG: hypothetical protein Q7S92_02320 [Candidatus Diapherotrites archaeon]|nr:hypothetical protein [Candidatus Diapherotrites archaeon]
MKPIKKFNSGTISAAVWENSGKEGNQFYTVSMQRSYKSKESTEWKQSHSLRVHDLPKAVLVLQEAYKFLALKEPNGATEGL